MFINYFSLLHVYKVAFQLVVFLFRATDMQRNLQKQTLNSIICLNAYESKNPNRVRSIRVFEYVLMLS